MEQTRKPSPDWLPYGLPMALFLGVTLAEGQFASHYVWVYIAKMVIVLGALIWAKPTWKDYKWDPKIIPISVVLGLVLFAMWVLIEKYVPYPHMGDRTAYNPWEKIPDAGLRTAFIAVRFFGLVLLVPFMEELFWRSFGLRYGSQNDFRALPVGQFTEVGAILCIVVFALSHPEWLVALIFGIAITVFLGKTKSLFGCFIIHAVTNLALGIYVMTQGAWTLW